MERQDHFAHGSQEHLKPFGSELGNPAEVPERPGTQPIPPGSIRVQHVTAGSNIESIRERGLTTEAASEQTTAQLGEGVTWVKAGAPTKEIEQSLRDATVEGWVRPEQIDVGGLTPGVDPAEEIPQMEKHESVLTLPQGLPRSQITAIHEPWHSTFRGLMEDEGRRKRVMSGQFDMLTEPEWEERDAPRGKAVNAAKTAIAAKVMLGGGV